jgi:heterodisulfide reductase subunit D
MERPVDSSKLEKEILETKVRLCLDCGKCTVVCPVSQYNPDFNPRRIIQRSLGKRKRDFKDENIWACFNCQMCLERCNYKVKFPDFVNALRAEAVDEGVKVQCSHGGALQAAMNLMGRGDLVQKRLDWLPADILVSKDANTFFFVGCAPYFDVIFEDIGVRTLDGVVGAMRLLSRLGISFNLLENERCCGRDLLLAGDKAGFLKLARANMAEFERKGVKKIITACPECHNCLKTEYGKIEQRPDFEVLNFVEVAAPLLGEIKLHRLEKEENVTFQDPCNLGRAFRVFEEPRRLLTAIPGMVLAEMKQNRENALCCGANPWAYCGAVNRQVQGERLNQARESGADILVTACPKCQIHLKCAQKSDKRSSAPIEIRDLASLLAEAAGGAINGG